MECPNCGGENVAHGTISNYAEWWRCLDCQWWQRVDDITLWKMGEKFAGSFHVNSGCEFREEVKNETENA